MISNDGRSSRSPSGRANARLAILAAVAVLAVGIVSWWHRFGASPDSPVKPEPHPADHVEVQRPALLPQSSRPTIRVELPEGLPIPTLPTLEDSDPAVSQALADLVGRKLRNEHFQANRFVRRFVATVDRLTEPNASAAMWPVKRIPGRFVVVQRKDEDHVEPHHGRRYYEFISAAESVDVKQAVFLYSLSYPLFQQAYEDLGTPGRYFNDRLIQVVDHLLAAPEPEHPVALRRVSSDPARPGSRQQYLFVDPALESLSSGQKIMVRIGLANERRMKAKLQALRDELTRSGSSSK